MHVVGEYTPALKSKEWAGLEAKATTIASFFTSDTIPDELNEA